MKIEGEGYLQRPPQMITPLTSHNKNRYCHFYQDHGHDTDQCIYLKNEIEDLIRHNYLEKFV